VVIHKAVVGDMYVRHQETVVADDRSELIRRTAIDGAAFADNDAVTDFRSGVFPFVLEVLWYRADDCAGEDFTTLADPRAVHDRHVVANPAIIADYDILFDHGERTDMYILPDFCIWVNDPQAV
jgi:hypothetical protein